MKTGKCISVTACSNWLHYTAFTFTNAYMQKWTLNQSLSPSVKYLCLAHASRWTGALRWTEPLSAPRSAWILSALLCFPTNSLIIMAREAGGRHVLDSDLHILCSSIKSAMDFLYCHSKIEVDDSQMMVGFKERRGQQWMRETSYS